MQILRKSVLRDSLRQAASLAAVSLALLSTPEVLCRAQTVSESKETASPLLTSWFTQNSGRYARVVEQRGGVLVATWPSEGLNKMGGGQPLPAYSDVQQIRYTSDYVYIHATGLASHQMGPWYIGLNRIFGNWPSNTNMTLRFPMHPQVSGTKSTNGLGPLGLWVNGVAFFNLLDGASYDAARGGEPHGPPTPGGLTETSVWYRNAVVVEQPTFDKSNAHQPPNGQYHYHDNPVALRYQLGDNIAFDAKTGNYTEDISKLHHSPILGWSIDGFPIYGPYAYSDPKNPNSPIRRMTSGYSARDGSHNTTDLRKSGRHTLAKWAAALHKTDPRLSPEQYGPDVSSYYTLGRYVEDFDFRGDLGETQGKDFDLDVYNGRQCITPDYPHGTYAYFVTINADGSPAFPYVIGRQWYGVPSGGQARAGAAEAKLYKEAGPKSEIRMEVANVTGGRQVKWTSVEGAHYKVEGSNDAAWSTVAEDVKSQGLSTTTTLRAGSPDASYASYRVTQVSLDKYDSVGQRMGPGGPGGRGGPGGVGQGGPRRVPGGDPGFGPPDGPGGPGGPGGGRPPFGDGGTGTISKITPATGEKGQTVSLQLSLSGIPAPPAGVQPSSVKLGKQIARKVRWDGATVQAEFSLAADAAAGAQTITVVFPGPPGSGFKVTFTSRNGFTVK